MSSEKDAKKQDHLAAGRRRLEEFRKQKKSGKKAGAPKQTRTPDTTLAEKRVSENGELSVDSAVPAAYGLTDGFTGASDFLNNNGKKHDISRDSGSEPALQVEDNFQSGNVSSFDLHQTLQKQVESPNDAPKVESQSSFASSQQRDKKFGTFETSFGEGRHAATISSDRPSDDNSSNFHSYFYGDHKDIRSSEGLFTNSLHDSVDSNRGFQASTMNLGHTQHGLLAVKNHLPCEANEIRPSDALSAGSHWTSDSVSGGMSYNISSSVNGFLSSSAADTYSRRSRPSFLDSLNIGRDSPGSGGSVTEKESSAPSNLPNSDFGGLNWGQDSSSASAPVEPLRTPVFSNSGDKYFGNGLQEKMMLENRLESKLDFNSQRQNEDFAALEQHIEDLTQEKFSLQRAMEASKALAESLAAENSSLTESYNQQASIVNQLKTEMDRLHGEIKARLVELEAIKAEYMNAQLECNAADERAKLLASEVISLEEKALRLRSSELKLERELEKSNAEIASYKKKLSSLDKDRRDLQQTIEALQEEKKLLQSKLRRASTSGLSIDLNKGHAKQDATTSTDDLRNDSNHASSYMERDNDTDNLLLLLQDRSAGFEDILTTIPPDQVQTIQNINSLMSEILSEKEELMQALLKEVSTSSKLKDLNKELSYKLEVQTQRLELLTAQSMASENITAKLPTSSRIEPETVAYADEGDEVVERVLGWIMKLFPGGPSKRRTSRL